MTATGSAAARDCPIAIVGAGAVTSIGIGYAAFSRALLAGRTHAEPAGFAVPLEEKDRAAGRHIMVSPVREFDAVSVVGERAARVADRSSLFAVAAAAEAIGMAGLDTGAAPERVGVVLGTALSAVDTVTRGQHALATGGAEALDGKVQMAAWPNMSAAQIMLRWQLRGPLLTVATACASSIDAFAAACQILERNEADFVIAGGTDSAINAFCVISAAKFGMTSAQADTETACRPFARDRDGILVGEGAGVLVLQRLRDARAQGRRVLGVIRGTASGADPYHITAPDPSGAGEARIMEQAMARVGVSCACIDAVIAHATGTPLGDLAEMRALDAVAATLGRRPPVTSIKGHIGHTTGASGALSVLAALAAFETGGLAPTAGTRALDPAMHFPVPLTEPARGRFTTILVNAFGFGGQNASLVVSRD
jgi:3-oxoacyl-[acyl-carrier-protein] synthase II